MNIPKFKIATNIAKMEFYFHPFLMRDLPNVSTKP